MREDYVLMKGNEAIAEAALRAGCRFYAGYPITPQSEILEYMADHMEERGGGIIAFRGQTPTHSLHPLQSSVFAFAFAISFSSI